jgi:hypothetical protein
VTASHALREEEAGIRVPGTRGAQLRMPAKQKRQRLGIMGVAQLVVAGAIAAGWWVREDRWLVPDDGLGYLLGIVGLGLMTLLLVYPLRKRVRLTHGWGRLGSWFQLHMLLGLAGPLAILFHSNFRLGSLNANIALACTLAVAASGVVGRVIYVKIHEGLDGRRRTLDELRDTLEETRSLALAMGDGQPVLEGLARFERRLLGDQLDGAPGATGLLLLPWRARGARKRAFEILRASARRQGRGEQRKARSAVRGYIRAVRSVAVFAVYERLFALWHVAHLPLCFLLYASAAVHVVAIHMY